MESRFVRMRALKRIKLCLIRVALEFPDNPAVYYEYASHKVFNTELYLLRRIEAERHPLKRAALQAELTELRNRKTDW